MTIPTPTGNHLFGEISTAESAEIAEADPVALGRSMARGIQAALAWVRTSAVRLFAVVGHRASSASDQTKSVVTLPAKYGSEDGVSPRVTGR